MALAVPRVDQALERDKRIQKWFENLLERGKTSQDVLSAKIDDMNRAVERNMAQFKRNLTAIKGEVKHLRSMQEEQAAASKKSAFGR